VEPTRCPALAYYCRTATIDDRQLALARASLSAQERARHDQRAVADDRRSFAVAHGLLRHRLADAIGRAPAQLTFDHDGFGKPFLVPDGDNRVPVFSLSHSRDVVACVVAPAGRVGIDVEPIRSSLDALGFARRFFSPDETAWLDASAPSDRARRLCALWTLKEALSKALGYGLGLPLTSTSFRISGGTASVAVFPPFDDDAWHCTSVDLGGTHMVGIVANAAAASAPVDLVEVDAGGVRQSSHSCCARRSSDKT
jgi:4'-phosphopantetheinyl transferase